MVDLEHGVTTSFNNFLINGYTFYKLKKYYTMYTNFVVKFKCCTHRCDKRHRFRHSVKISLFYQYIYSSQYLTPADKMGVLCTGTTLVVAGHFIFILFYCDIVISRKQQMNCVVLKVKYVFISFLDELSFLQASSVKK